MMCLYLVRMQRGFLLVLLLAVVVGCSKDDPSAGGHFVKARVLYVSCAGTVLQFIDSTGTANTDWRWFAKLKEPFDASNPTTFYPNTVTAFAIPVSRQAIGDTLAFTYSELTAPSGLVCALGGLPTRYISVNRLKNRQFRAVYSGNSEYTVYPHTSIYQKHYPELLRP